MATTINNNTPGSIQKPGVLRNNYTQKKSTTFIARSPGKYYLPKQNNYSLSQRRPIPEFPNYDSGKKVDSTKRVKRNYVNKTKNVKRPITPWYIWKYAKKKKSIKYGKKS